VTEEYDPDKTFDIRSSQFDRNFQPGIITEPKTGRFYPKGILKDIPNVFRDNIAPFRCVVADADNIRVDFNHPMAGRELRLETTMHRIQEKASDKGGRCQDWIEVITEGAGMQIRCNGRPTDFFSDNPFAREDETPDSRFYKKPRFVNHLDDTAIRNISRVYKKLLTPEMAVLDLMSSWTSHLPEDLVPARMTGLGMNADELDRNPVLNNYILQDLNENIRLPFGDAAYDAVLCAASVEYLNQPFEIFQEVARVLKTGGYFIVSFSNRWFPTKAINIWKEISEFERVGLVMEYFLVSEMFKDIGTWSMRGMPRPEGDKYYGELPYSDPVYCVWGCKA